MSAPLLQFGCTMMCPHGGMVLQAPSQTKVLAGGKPVLLAADAAAIVGCPFFVGTAPHPCLTVTWSGLATKVSLQQQPPLLATSVGQCFSGDETPQGVLLISDFQTKVLAL